MENRAHALAAGIFVLLMALGLLAAAAWMQGDRTERVRYTVVARTAVSGLNVKAPVKLRGVDVGKVEEIRFDPADARLILVTIAVDKTAPLARSSYARLGLQGVTGLSFIDLNDDGQAGPLLADVPAQAGAQTGAGRPRIELRPTLFDQLSEALPALVADVGAISKRVNQALGDANQAQLTRTLVQAGSAAENLSRLAAGLQATAHALPPLLQATGRAAREVQGAAQQAAAVAGEGRALVADLRQRSTPVLDRLGSAVQQIEATTLGLELALVGPQRARGRPVLDELSAASRAIEKIAQDLGDQPQSLILGPAPRLPGPGESGFAARLAGPP